ncbi:MAG: hypothetical protein JWM46_362 [Candidatus Kaiserbacteria bacterium]|nr:hypothetical protein [Candidatus Kaiserbacteria bacterium]
MNTTKWFAALIGVIIIGVISFAIFHERTPGQDTHKIKVATGFYPEYFFASQIGGDKADVVNITPADAEPHDYEPTAQDMATIENSRMLVLNGGVEPWGVNMQKNLDPNKTLIVTAGEGLETQQVVEGGQSVTDPHVWQSPTLAKKMVDKIERGFVQIDPSNTSYYAANAEALKSQLDQLDSEFKTGLASCAKKDIITSHAAFGYLATTYHLTQVAITGLSPDAEPSTKELADIADFARKNNVKIIFFESLVSPKLSQTIASEVGAETMVLDPLEGLSADDLAAGKDYMTVMRNNLANLRKALECI